MEEFPLKNQKGFTLIELLAVMAIVAVLAGTISISVAGSGQTSRDTQSRQDATSVESALASYLGSRDSVEVLTFKVATVLGRIEVRQVISTSWPENVTSDAYPKVFPEGEISTVRSVTFLDSDAALSDLTARGLMQGYNAIDFDLLFDEGFLTTIPNSARENSQDFSSYLWLLEKSFAAGGSGRVSSREVAVFKLTSVDEISGSDLVDITYRLLFGGDFSDQHPVASNQTITTNEDTSISITLSGTDLESCELTFLIEEDPSNGGLTNIFDNLCSPGEPNTDSASVTYSPKPNFNGTDSFTYSVIDGNGDDIATITVTINVVNDAPIADNDTKETAEDTPLVFSAADLLTNDKEAPSNESGQVLTVTGVTSPTSQGGTVVLLNGQITYSPADDFNGEDQFTYTVTDNGTTNGAADPLSSTATVIVTVTEVNDAPIADNDTKETAEDTPLVFSAADLLTNDKEAPSNESGQVLTVTGVTSPTSQGGTVVLSNGQITYSPADDFNGEDQFTYTVTDNGTTNGAADPLSSTATVIVTVTEVNDAPIADNDTKETAEDTPLVFLASDLLTNDKEAGPSNEIGQDLTVINVTSGSTQGGTVVLENGQITYTPAADFNGEDQFTYTVEDNGKTNGAEDPLRGTATVTVTVNPVNDTPSFDVGDNQRILEGSGFHEVIEWATNISTGADNESTQGLTFKLSFSPNPNALFSVQPQVASDGTLTYTLASGTTGEVTIDVKLEDNGPGLETSLEQPFTITVVSAAPLSNGSFESGNDPGTHTELAKGSTDISDWSIISGTIDYIGTTWKASQGVRNIDLSGRSPGTISQTFETVVDTWYTVLFHMARNPTNQHKVILEVSAAGDSNEHSFTTPGVITKTDDMRWEQKSFNFIAIANTTTLTFTSTTFDDPSNGPALDNVRVAAVILPVIVDIDANDNVVHNHLGTAVQVPLHAGTYTLTAIGPLQGGLYTAWSAWLEIPEGCPSPSLSDGSGCDTGWLNNYSFSSPSLGTQTVGDLSNRFETPEKALAAAPSPTVIALPTAQTVEFWISDLNLGNFGGLSVLITRVDGDS